VANTSNPIEKILDRETKAASGPAPSGKIAAIMAAYSVRDSNRLLGFLLDMGYDEMRLVTNDSWKRKCGGLPKNSFILVKLNEEAAGLPRGSTQPFIILARVTETATTPVASDIQSTIFQIHKVQAKIDPLTNAELQWGALKAAILGTYYDGESGVIVFGNDVDSFLSPHFYEIFVPTDDHLQTLINCFVEKAHPIEIGRLRYTETETLGKGRNVAVQISPLDFVANRTALFGKTRMGKSNTIKVILDTMLRTVPDVGQVVFDLSGEYTYPDPQTGASIALSYGERCSRYSLKPRHPDLERRAGIDTPSMLRANFYSQVELGHAIILSLFDVVHNRRPDYMAAFLGWEPVDNTKEAVAVRFPNEGDQQRYVRALSMYLAMLHAAGFAGGDRLTVDLMLHEPIREALAQDADLAKIAECETRQSTKKQQVRSWQRLPIAVQVYRKLWALFDPRRDDATLFPVSERSGKPYFEGIHQALLRMLGDDNISGPKKLTPFKDYHDPKGSDVVRRIVKDVEDCKTVLIDLARDPVVARYYSELICKAVFAHQMTKFSELEAVEFEKKSVLFYFEEAHNLFRADDKDLTSIYNKLAKEGAKFRIGMVYATQSMTTLSPDLLKNTENFFIAHLNDDREIREIERRYEFSGIGLDVQRAKTKGYARMITLSHRYALPVQIKLFKPPTKSASPGPKATAENELPF
jgi:hypothetical protein